MSRFGQFEQLEDVVQESLIALHRTRHTYRPRGDLIDETGDMETSIYEGQLLLRLRPPYRQAFILTKLEGLSISETTEQLGISEATLRATVFRALRMVRQMLQADIA